MSENINNMNIMISELFSQSEFCAGNNEHMFGVFRLRREKSNVSRKPVYSVGELFYLNLFHLCLLELFILNIFITEFNYYKNNDD